MVDIKTIKNLLLFLLLFAPISGVLLGQEQHQATPKEEAFNASGMILHHIGDSHNFHILDWKGHPVSMPLPIILWTNNGLVTFMSNKFEHDEDGKVVVENKGQKFTIFHDKVYYANEQANADGEYVTLDEAQHPIN